MDNPKAEINSFFTQVQSKSKSKNSDDIVYSYMYICAKEFSWTQKDFEETDIPYLFAVLRKRVDAIKEEERQMRKRR